jgi:uncharacterized protein YbjT (DUF2867 family)
MAGLRVLVAGASGTLGRLVLARLRERGCFVRAVTRQRDARRRLRLPANEIVGADLSDPALLAGIAGDMEVVFSCAGASMDLSRLTDRATFEAVDHLGNAALLEEARGAGSGRFVYVSLAGADRLSSTAYASAHERFVARLQGSGLPFTVIRPTGFYSFLAQLVGAARAGFGFVIGDGADLTNPVHEEDVAEACADAITGEDSARSIELGGPDVLSRRRIVEMAFEALGKRPRLRHVSPSTFRRLAAPARWLNPRVHQLLDFGVAVSTTDIVAPRVGERRLADYFARLAGREA